MNPEEFRAAGHRLIDWIADYRASLHARPVSTPIEPGSVRSQLPAHPPDEPESVDRMLEDLDRIVLPALVHWQHPRFFGLFPAVASPASVLGDLVSTGLGVMGVTWQSSPPLTEVEEVTVDWMRQMLGLSEAWSGVIEDTASTSTLLALICARERSASYSLDRGGFQSDTRPLIVYTSAFAHSSVNKAALLAGFGRANVRIVPHDDAFAMRADAFAQMVHEDIRAGATPCAIVATTGTTTTTACDPLEAIAETARRHGVWLHVDAAMAGSAMILPECRHLWQGVEQADSVIVNPHKWLGVAFDCTLYYVRDAQHLIRVMSTNPSYLQTAADGRVKSYRDWGIPLGRRFRALKLWFLIREQGVTRLQARLRRDIANAQLFADMVRATPPWRVLAPVPLQTVCIRHEPDGLSGDALDRHTLTWVDRINRSGVAYLTPATLEGRWMVRVSIGAESTERDDVEKLWTALRASTSA